MLAAWLQMLPETTVLDRASQVRVLVQALLILTIQRALSYKIYFTKSRLMLTTGHLEEPFGKRYCDENFIG